MTLWRKLRRTAFGRWLFTRIICWRALFFSSRSPLFVRLDRTGSEVTMRKRRKVQNHIGTVHAIAMANLCELAAGTLMEAALPVTMRWIPKGMSILYLAKAATDMRATAEMPIIEEGTTVDAMVLVNVRDEHDVTVVRAKIEMHVSRRPSS